MKICSMVFLKGTSIGKAERLQMNRLGHPEGNASIQNRSMIPHSNCYSQGDFWKGEPAIAM